MQLRLLCPAIQAGSRLIDLLRLKTSPSGAAKSAYVLLLIWQAVILKAKLSLKTLKFDSTTKNRDDIQNSVVYSRL
jgi:hypothetical protein